MKILKAFIPIVLLLMGCRKEKDVTFVEDDKKNALEIVGTQWVSPVANIEDHIQDMVVYKDNIIFSLLYYKNGNFAYSAESSGNDIRYHFASLGGGSGFERLKVIQDELYGMGAVGIYGAWKYAPETWNQWEPYARNGTNFYDLEKYNNQDVIATGFAPSVYMMVGFTFDTLGDGFNKSATCLTMYNGDLIAGGGFSKSGSKNIQGIARWNGNSWEQLGQGIDGTVNCMTVMNGKLIVGGSFKKSGSTVLNSIAIWDGSTWSTMNEGFKEAGDAVYCLAVNGDELIVGGDFQEAGGEYSPNIIKWAKNKWVALPAGVPSSVGSMVIYKNRLYVTNSSTFDQDYFLRLE